MRGRLACAMMGVSRKSLCIVFFLALACTNRRAVADLAAERLRSFDGAVLVFVPNTCKIRAPVFHALNHIDSLAGVKVLGVVAGIRDDRDELAGVGRDFGATFRLVPEAGEEWQEALAASGLSEPALFIVRHGAVAVVIAGPQLERWGGQIPGFGLE